MHVFTYGSSDDAALDHERAQQARTHGSHREDAACRADPAPATMLIHKIKQIKQTVRTHLLNAAHDSDGSTVKWRNRARFAEFLL